jgi:hypothetical protein
MFAASRPYLLLTAHACCTFCRHHEELRVTCGTQGVPDTVAPFRAWRGSRDLVAQSPKLHVMAVAVFPATANPV